MVNTNPDNVSQFLTDRALDDLTDEELDRKYELPCCDQHVPLRELLGEFKLKFP